MQIARIIALKDRADRLSVITQYSAKNLTENSALQAKKLAAPMLVSRGAKTEKTESYSRREKNTPLAMYYFQSDTFSPTPVKPPNHNKNSTQPWLCTKN